MSDDDLRGLLTDSVTRQALEAAAEELSRHGLRAKRSIDHEGRRWNSGSEVMVNRLGEYHATFTVVCEGDRDNAIAAFDSWLSRLSAFGGIGEIGRMSVRGTDGTNLVRYSDEAMEAAANLDDETAARIDELMDPDR